AATQRTIYPQMTGSEGGECTKWDFASSRVRRAGTGECGTQPRFALKRTNAGSVRTTSTVLSPSLPAALDPVWSPELHRWTHQTVRSLSPSQLAHYSS